MVLLKVLLFATLAIFSATGPVQAQNQAQSFSSFSSGLVQSAAPLALAAAPITISQAPVIQAPVLQQPVEHYAPPHYEFKYGVKDSHTHDVKEQAEKRVGDRVEGYYSLLEPDGTTRTVKYTADKHTGFNAIVTKSGHAQHPTIHKVHKVVSAPVLSIAQPAPVLSFAQSAPAISLAAAPAQIQGGATSFNSFSALGK